jgi:hypothetical protein
MVERINVTESRVMDVLREVVAERPDYVYKAPGHQVAGLESCFYVHTDAEGNDPKPGCLVGAVLHRLGVPLEELAEREGTGAYIVASELLCTTMGAAHALDYAQSCQDAGDTWAGALSAAEAVIPTCVLV